MRRHGTERMRYGWLLCAISALLLVGVVAWAAEDTGQAANPITNGDFENGNAGWKLGNGKVTEENPHNGKACLRLDRTEKGGAIALQFITLEPDTWYVCEFYYKIVGTPGLSRLRLMGEDVAEGKRRMPAHVYFFDRYEQDQWARGINHIYSNKAGRCELEILVFINPIEAEKNLQQNATLWLDDLVLRPMTSADMKGELIENGDFEDGRPGCPPPGWSRVEARKPGFPAVAVTDKEAHAGKQALEIKMGPPQDVKEGAYFIRTSGQRRLPLGRTYTLSFWAKSSRPADSRIIFSGPAMCGPTIHLIPEWQQFTYEVVTTPEQQAASKWGHTCAFNVMGPLSIGDVTFWYDDVSLRRAGQ